MLIGKHYEIQSQLGAGGMGTVYRGIDTRTGQTVAIKQLKPEIAQSELLERFQREGEALRQLNHPNIVKSLAAFEENKSHYLVMEYVAGGDLSQLLKKGALPLEQVLKLAIDLADALTRAHKLDIIHRDLKPANVLIGSDGILRLTDFGIAHLEHKPQITQTEVELGTLAYMSPEALSGVAASPKMDIWAFGVLLFEMLTGKYPFQAPSLSAQMQAILFNPLPDLEALAPHAPVSLVDLIYRMLERDPQARISSVRHVGAGLEDILRGRANTPSPRRFETPLLTFNERPKHNLPAQTTPFVGREHELEEIAKLISDPTQRLITILAPGGMGKTRLSLEAAERQIDNFRDGSYFVDLTPLSDPTSIINAIAEATQFPLSSNDNRSSKQQVLDFLANKTLLLLIDNWEHLLSGAALATEILHIAPQVKILATSRQRLDQASETLFHLSGMDFPDWETPEDALDYAAVKLFMNSARRMLPSFELTQANLDSVARICKLVGGMPLGIVLAATWLDTLSPNEIAEEIAKSIDFLESSSSGIPIRQRSMQAIFDYSWQMMNADEQSVFAAMSIFKGSFTRQAGQTVTGASLRTLQSLVNKSLLRRNSETGRYAIHELLRQYAASHLESSGQADKVRTAHLAYYTQSLQDYLPDLRSKAQALKELDMDFENYQSAWLWGSHTQAWQQLGLMAEALRTFAIMRSREEEIINLFRPLVLRFMQQAQHTADEEKLMYYLAAYYVQGKDDQFTFFEEVLRFGLLIAQKHADSIAIAHCYRQLSLAIVGQNRLEEALDYAQKAVQLYQEEAYLPSLPLALLMVGYIKHDMGDVDAAFHLWQEALAIARATNNKSIMIFLLSNLSNIYQLWKKPKESLLLVQESLSISREIGSPHLIGSRLGEHIYQTFLGLHLDEVRELMPELRSLAYQSNHYQLHIDIYQFELFFHLLEGAYAEALVLIEKIDHLLEPMRVFLRLGEYQNVHCLVFALAGHHEESLTLLKQRHPFRVDGTTDLQDFGLAIVALLAQRQDYQRCAEMLSATLHDRPDWLFYTQLPFVKDLQARLEQELGTAVYQAAWERGKSLDLIKLIQAFLDENTADT